MLVKTLAHGRLVVQRILKSWSWVAVDTETSAKTGFDPDDALVFGRMNIRIFGACYRGEVYSFPTSELNSCYPSTEEWMDLFAPIFAHPKIVKVCHNINYDGNVFYTAGVREFTPIWCTVIGAWLSNEEMSKSLKNRCHLYGRFLRETDTVNFSSTQEISDYVEDDCIQTDEMYQMHQLGFVQRSPMVAHLDAKQLSTFVRPKLPLGKFKIEGEELSDFKRHFAHLHELPVLRAVMRAERLGFPFDLPLFLEIRNQLDTDREKTVKALYRAAGREFNLNSSKQFIEVLGELGVAAQFTTRKGTPSVSAGNLFKMQEAHPIIKMKLQYAKLEKLQSTYCGTVTKQVKGEEIGSEEDGDNKGIEHFLAKDGCVHGSMNSVGARTGRFSADKPNLQNLPARNDPYKIRRCFTARKGQSLIVLDYCFHPTTLIDTPEGNRPISSLRKGDRVFSLRDNSSVVLNEVKHSYQVRSLPAYSITFDNGESVIASSDHKWPTRQYKAPNLVKKTSDLRVGDRMVPLRRQVSHQGYVHLYSYSAFNYVKEHELVGAAYHGERAHSFGTLVEHFHHKDENKLNNHPSNLQRKSRSIHLSDHSKLAFKQQNHALRLERLKEYQLTIDHRGSKNPRFGFRKGPRTACLFCSTVFYKPPCYAAKFCSRSCAAKARWRGLNHRITSIEYLGVQPMWSIEVTPDHNYFLGCGVLTNNCQLEIRIMALHCKDAEITASLVDPARDIHQDTADKFRVPRNPTAKNLNFLMLYGGQNKMLAEKLTQEGTPTTPEQAQAFIDTYNAVYPRVREWRLERVAEQQQSGLCKYWTGRTRHLADVNWLDQFARHRAETTLSNNIIQGGGQDFLKASIIRCDPLCVNPDAEILKRNILMSKSHRAIIQGYATKLVKLRRLLSLAKTKWLLQVHDESIFSCDKAAAEDMLRLIADVMTWRHFFPPLSTYTVPLAVEGGIGANWFQAKNEPVIKVKSGYSGWVSE